MKYSGIDLLGSSPGGPKPSKMSILPNSLLFFTIWKTIFGVRCIQNDDTVPTCILGTPTHLQWSIIASFKVNLNKNTEKRCCGVFFCYYKGALRLAFTNAFVNAFANAFQYWLRGSFEIAFINAFMNGFD